MLKTPVLAVVGPTAAGKSALAMHIARQLPVEIVCMDSMQVFCRMDIGTAKPRWEDRQEVPHHMLDVAQPTQAFSVSQYVDRAAPLLHAIWQRGRLPLLVGGTGLYLKALMQGLSLGGATGDDGLRQKLHAVAQEPDGPLRLHDRLQTVDPAAASRLHPNDLRRVIRALEVFELTGKPISQQNQPAAQSEFAFALLGATLPRDELYQRADRRVDAMLAQGLAREVEGLLASGVSADCQSMQGIGYKELIPMLEGYLSLEDAIALMKRNTRRYAKRQWTWFQAVEGIRWLNMEESGAAAEGMAFAKDFWQGQAKRIAGR